MTRRAAISINRPREGVERMWRRSDYRPDYIDDADAAVTFVDAPGDRGTEIHVDLDDDVTGGKLGEAVRKLAGDDPLSKVKDDLRRFKAHVETGVIPRSDGTPEGELAERKTAQRPAQPLDESETEKAGV